MGVVFFAVKLQDPCSPSLQLLLGGVNYCSVHCRLAKFRGLMYPVKYGALIGFETSIAWKLLLGTYKNTRFSANHSAVFDLVHQTTEFRQSTV